MEQIDFTLLTMDEIFSDNKLDIIKEFGAEANLTDYAKICYGRENYPSYFTRSKHDSYSIYAIDFNGNTYTPSVENHSGIRPAFSYSSIFDIPIDKVCKNLTENLLEIELGTYPQQAVADELQKELNFQHKSKNIKTTGNSYIVTYFSHWTRYFEYEYNGKKYVRIGIEQYKPILLSNGIEYKQKRKVWIEVQPIKWIVDKRHKIVLAKDILTFQNYDYNSPKDWKLTSIRNYREFNSTDLKKYLDETFVKEIFYNNLIKDRNEEKPKDKITQLLDEINQYIKYADNKEKLVNKLNDLLGQYNKDIEMVMLNKKLTFNNVNDYKSKLIIELEKILTKLKEEYEKKRHFEDIKHLLEQCLNILHNENKEEINNELCTDFKKIYQINSFLDKSNFYEQFKILITDEINRIEEYLNNTNIKELEYHDQESFELYFRKKIHPLLLELPHKVINKDIQNKLDSMKKAKETLELNGEQITNFYLKEIEKEIKVIKVLDSNIALEEYLHIEKDLNINDSVKELVNILIKLYKIEYDLRKEKENKDNIKKLQIRYEFQ